MRDQGRFSPQYQADNWWEKIKISVRGLLFNAVPNWHHENCKAGKRRNAKEMRSYEWKVIFFPLWYFSGK